MRKQIVLFSTLFLLSLGLQAQKDSITKRVLFLGNSYTYVNDIPKLVQQMTSSTGQGDTLIYDFNTPGGYTLKEHSSNATSIAKIKQGDWDHMVLQEQSQLPSLPLTTVEKDVYPYAKSLDSLFHAFSDCGETIFYRTWGRKNGDASNCNSWPVVCTYEGMDSMLKLRYLYMAQVNTAILSPVGEVWRYIRTNNPGIELYDADESHPSAAGSYLAACCHYATIFRRNPQNITFDFTIDPGDAAIIRNAVKSLIHDKLYTWNWEPQVNSNFAIDTSARPTIHFINKSTAATHYQWNFGDGTSDTNKNVSHTYMKNGVWTAQLIAKRCPVADTTNWDIKINNVGLFSPNRAPAMRLYPNPAQNRIQVMSSEIFEEQPFRILDVSGKVLLEGIIDQSDPSILISSLPDGVYFLSIGEGNREASRFVKR